MPAKRPPFFLKGGDLDFVCGGIDAVGKGGRFGHGSGHLPANVFGDVAGPGEGDT
jgi:hypothetical protein